MNIFKKIFSRNNIFIIIIAFLLAIIPLFWFKPGYIDIGGDSSRLYFYDPSNFLKSYVLNLFWPDTVGITSNAIYLLPFTLILLILHTIFQSPYVVNTIFNIFTLLASFLVIFGISWDFLIRDHPKNKNTIFFASILAGLFYIFIPISSLAGWDLPLIIFVQRFVYPLVLWLILRYVYTFKQYYLLLAVGVSVIFAQNFSWAALPNFLGFLFVSILLIMYVIYTKKIKLNVFELLFYLLLFLLLQGFQYIPFLFNIFEKSSSLTNQLAQGANLNDLLKYVAVTADYTERGYAFFGLSPFTNFSLQNLSLFFFPLILVMLLIKNRKSSVLFYFLIFLILCFIVTARVTDTGFKLYELFFHIPGFVMFRNFYGKWEDTYLFVYAIIIGYAAFTVLLFLKKIYLKIIFFFLFVGILIFNAIPFITGEISNRILTQDTGVVVKSRVAVDPEFEKVLHYIENRPQKGRNMSLPLADFSYQIVAGKNNDGAYFGPSMIAYLSGKTDLSSSTSLQPFSQAFYDSIKNGDIATAENIFPLLNIQSVFYDSNPYIYEVFATFPYNEAKLYMPKTQSGIATLVKNLPLLPTANFGKNYHMYSVTNSYFLPIIYAAQEIFPLDPHMTASASAYFVLKNFRTQQDVNLKKAFVSQNIQIGKLTNPDITFIRVNSSEYIVHIHNATGPYLLVFSQLFNSNWNVQLKQKNQVEDFLSNEKIASRNHILVNAYANGWYISPSDVRYKKDYTLIVEMRDAKIQQIAFAVSGAGIILYVCVGVKLTLSKKKIKK